MSVTVMPLKLTAAEEALAGRFDGEAAGLPGNKAVADARKAAMTAIRTNGLPTRRVEAWHYTELRRLLAAFPESAGAGEAAALEPIVPGSTLAAAANGAAAASPSAPGVSFTRMVSKFEDGSFAPAMALRGADDAIGAINNALASDGWFADIADGVELEAPVEIQNLVTGGQSHTRFPVRVGKGARATIVERQAGEGAAFATSVSNLAVGDGAEVTWVIVQERDEAADHLGQLNAELGDGARLTVLVLNAGGRLVRQEVHVAVAGENSELAIKGVNLIGKGAHVDVTTSLIHSVPNTTATEIFRNVVTKGGKGVFQGQIKVAQIAQKTDARMACNTLLLSDDADFSAKPELEIFADDVGCAHGATVSDISDTHLFYLRARGIPERLARAMLVKAFVEEVFEELDNEAIGEALVNRIENWLDRNG